MPWIELSCIALANELIPKVLQYLCPRQYVFQLHNLPLIYTFIATLVELWPSSVFVYNLSTEYNNFSDWQTCNKRAKTAKRCKKCKTVHACWIDKARQRDELLHMPLSIWLDECEKKKRPNLRKKNDRINFLLTESRSILSSKNRTKSVWLKFEFITTF